jgi:hypothetical protein
MTRTASGDSSSTSPCLAIRSTSRLRATSKALVIDQRLLDQHVDIALAQGQLAPLAHLCREAFGHGLGDPGHESPVARVEDLRLLLLARKQQVRQRRADGVGHLARSKETVPSPAAPDACRPGVQDVRQHAVARAKLGIRKQRPANQSGVSARREWRQGASAQGLLRKRCCRSWVGAVVDEIPGR